MDWRIRLPNQTSPESQERPGGSADLRAPSQDLGDLPDAPRVAAPQPVFHNNGAQQAVTAPTLGLTRALARRRGVAGIRGVSHRGGADGRVCVQLLRAGDRDPVTVQTLVDAFEKFPDYERRDLVKELTYLYNPTMPVGQVLDAMVALAQTPKPHWSALTGALVPFRDDPACMELARKVLDGPAATFRERLSQLRRMGSALGTHVSMSAVRGVMLVSPRLTAETQTKLLQVLPSLTAETQTNLLERLGLVSARAAEQIIRGLEATTPGGREGAMQHIEQLCGATGRREAYIPEAYLRVPEGDRPTFVGQALKLLGNQTPADGRETIVSSLAALPAGHRDEFITQCGTAVGRNTNGKNRGTIAWRLRHTPRDERDTFAKAVATICGRSINGANRAAVAVSMRKVPHDYREKLADRVAAMVANHGLYASFMVDALALVHPDTYDTIFTQADRLFPDDQLLHFHSAVDFLRTTPPDDADACIEHVRALGLSPDGLSIVLDALTQVAPEARRGVLAVGVLSHLEHLAHEPEDVGTLLQRIADDPDDVRLAHLQRLVENRVYNDGDDENVMNARMIARTNAAIERFYEQTPPVEDVASGLAKIETYFTERYSGSQPDVDPREIAYAKKKRAGATELENVLRVLNGERQPHDYSDALTLNQPYTVRPDMRIGLGELVVRIWNFIDNYQGYPTDTESVEQAKESMRVAIFGALKDCIAKDGHRVCGTGFTRRLMQALQGRCKGVYIDSVPTPNEFFNFASNNFFVYRRKAAAETGVSQAPLGDADYERFYTETLGQARDVYGEDHADYRDVVKQTQRFLDTTYDWRPAD